MLVGVVAGEFVRVATVGWTDGAVSFHAGGASARE